jgi:mono/diheme cytochrome c family protein
MKLVGGWWIVDGGSSSGVVAVGLVALLCIAGGPARAQGTSPNQKDTALKKGNETYQYWCATCHGRGPGHPGTVALTAKYKGALPGVLEERTDLTPQTVRFAVRRGTSIMPFFRKTEVSDADLDAIAQYLTRRAAPRAGQSNKP